MTNYDEMTVQEVFDAVDYHNLEQYQTLSSGDQLFFDKLYKHLLINGEITWSNEKLASVLNCSESTMEKRLKRLDQAGLITRTRSNYLEYDGKWRTAERTISLNKEYFFFDFNSLIHKIYCDNFFYEQLGNSMDKVKKLPFKELKKMLKELKEQ